MASQECHLFVFMAHDAHRAVILRRGPQLWTQMIVWHTDTDRFTKGQWFKGNIYNYRCDLSPDGTKFIYFAAKHYKSFKLTAISHPPYFTALVMWKESGTWHSGGYFGNNRIAYIRPTDNDIKTYLQELPGGFQIRPLSADLRQNVSQVSYMYGDEIYFRILLRQRGWVTVQHDPAEATYSYASYIWQKYNPDHSHSLMMTLQSGFGNTAIWKFSLMRHQDHRQFKIDTSDWADWDQRGRLVYSSAGQLFTANLRSDRIEPVLLADFTANRPKLIPSPAWAKTWNL